MSAGRRYPALDLLRLVAITLTMLTHTPSIGRGVAVLRPFWGGCWLGVDLFMLISGWLLGGQLLRDNREGALRPLRFYVKRWLRTLPLYYVVLAGLYFGSGREFAGPLPPELVAAHVLFLQGYATPNLFAVSWSLCVEEHFYLALPLVVALLARWPRLRIVLALLVTLELTAIVLRWWIYAAGPHGLDVPYLSVLRNHGLFLGLLMAWIDQRRPALWARIGEHANVLLGLGIPCTALLMASSGRPPNAWMYVAMPTLGAWALALTFVACVHPRSAVSRFDFRGLSYLAGLTYAMYLTHTVTPRAWLDIVHPGAIGAAVWKLALVVGLSVVLHHAVERPGLWLRERLLTRWSSRGARTRIAPRPAQG